MGEGEAGRYLESKGYRLVAVNWRNPRDRRDELDLVCREGGILVFVEVKTRKAGGLVRGLTALNQRKQLVLRRAIRAYLASLTWRQRPHTYRVDVVEVEYRSLLGGATPALEGVEVFHYEHYPLFHGNSF